MFDRVRTARVLWRLAMLDKDKLVALLKTAGKAALQAALLVVFTYFGIKYAPVQVEATAPDGTKLAATVRAK